MKITGFLTVSLMLFGALSGCSSPQTDFASAGLVDVSGTVTMDGQPLAEALVMFESEDGRFSYGRTDAEGRYQLRFNDRATGVIPGPKTVRISTAMSATEEEAATPKIEMIPAKYNADSELKAEVRPGESQTFDFDLTSEGKIEQPKFEAGES